MKLLARKNIRISKWFLVGVSIYVAFIAMLYLRMKNSERMLQDYYDARACQVPTNCRKLMEAQILDYRLAKISFINYGSRGLPVGSGTFEEYRFTLFIGGSETTTAKVLPDTPSNVSGFDVAKVYIPTRSDKTLVNTHLFDGKAVFVEVWRKKVTLIIASLPVQDQASVAPPQESLSIGPKEQQIYELTLPTENNPVILAEDARKDLSGWTGGIVLLIVGPFIFGSIVVGFFYGIDWLLKKIAKKQRKRHEN